MKSIYKQLLVLLSVCFSNTVLFSQTTVQIGDGTTPSSPTLYSPIYVFSATSATSNARSNILFTQAELATAGIMAGSTISSLQFNKRNNSSFVTPANFSMYMGNTTNNALATTTSWASILSTHTLVYSNSAFNVPAVAGWVVLNITPFVYTGGSLEIATDLITTGSGSASGPFFWEYTNTVSADKVIGAAGTTAPAVLNGTGANYKHRPNIRITYMGSAMPVKLTSFFAIKNYNEVQLLWKTNIESNFSHFIIEKSNDLMHYRKIKLVTSKGNNSNYELKDVFTTGYNYYRLKIVDKDGSFEYSKVVYIKDDNALKVGVYPNPATNVVSFNYPKTSDKQSAKIYNVAGIQVSAFFIAKESSQTLIDVSDYPKGLYFIEYTADNRKQRVSFLIQ